MKMRLYYLVVVIGIISLGACQGEPGERATGVETEVAAVAEEVAVDSAQLIIDKAMEVHGADKIRQSTIEFDFRGRHYVATRDGGAFQYERIFEDKQGDQIRDVLTNTDFYRERNGAREQLSAKDSSAYSNSVNSVVYFALLPYFLNDGAVQKTYLGEAKLNQRWYHKIKVTFAQEGGGKDFEDEYIYWINKGGYTMDYLAYNYQVNGGGARFRAAYNFRVEKGIRFADYRNMKPLDGSMEVASFDALYEADQLKEVSRIETENVRVDLQRLQ